jgi:hypothetical protein
MSEFSQTKLLLLKNANEKMHLCDDLSLEKNKNLIFVYCPPKVGSTSLVTSFRMCALGKYTILHIHDEQMLSVLCGINNVSINELIRYNKMLGKNVYVVDIYRTPIEHKISVFFEKISSFHFNNTDENVNNYNIMKVIGRFNKLFPHLSKSDYYKEVYNIPFPDNFDFNSKYLLQTVDGIKYVKLRLKDSADWQTLFQQIFGVNIKIINDYETDKKPIKDLFNRFKQIYRIPSNFMRMIEDCESLKYYYSPQEREDYLNQWRNKQTLIVEPYSAPEYKLYMELTIENQHIGEVQREHYMDTGCICAGCCRKRNINLFKLSKGETVVETIDHNAANIEYRNMIIERRRQKLNSIVRSVALINAAQKAKINKNPKNIVKSSFNRQLK